MTDFIGTGGDGYECLREPSVVCVKDIESAAILNEMVMQSIEMFEPGNTTKSGCQTKLKQTL